MSRAFVAPARDCLSPRPPAASLIGGLGALGLVLALAGIAAGPTRAAVPADTLDGSGDSAIVTFDQADGSRTSMKLCPGRRAP